MKLNLIVLLLLQCHAMYANFNSYFSIWHKGNLISDEGNQSTIYVSAQSSSESLPHYWSLGVGAGRVNEGLRASWREQLTMAHRECGFRYVRMHDVFNDDMFTCFPQRDGSIKYNWQYVDDVYDAMLKMGVRPFVELAFFPSCLAAKNSKTQFWYRAHVSVDSTRFDAWHDLVRAFTQHVVDRYGLEEVQQWYFEVWNEPNLTGTGGFLHGTRSQYFRLYKEAALAIKSVNSRLRVGGPATSNFIADHRHDGEILDQKQSRFYPPETINRQQWKGVWIEEFLAYCASEKLPVDFISTHTYPTDYALDPETGRGRGAVRYVHSLHDDLTWLRAVIAKSHYPKAELHITEWSTSPNSRDRLHDNLPPAAYIVKTMLDCRGLAESVMYWTFTDIFEEKGGAATPFHGGFGMMTFQGWKKPSYHAFRMLHALGDEQLYYADPIIVTRDSHNHRITALAVNYPDEYIQKVPDRGDIKHYMKAGSKTIDLCINDLPPHASFAIETLDDTHGNALRAFQQLGSPETPTREQSEWMKKQSMATLIEEVKADANGTLRIRRVLQPWTLMLFRQIKP